jgi:hypothetical protein
VLACKAFHGRFMSTSHLHFLIMTAQEYIQTKLEELRKPLDLPTPQNDEELAEAIFKLLMSKKFRKYSATPEFIEHIKQSIRGHIEAGTPINITFTHGAYKLWRFKESPEVDWAELFALMYYTKWLKSICEIYRPGIWFDSFVDDLIIPKLNNVDLSEVGTYKLSYQKLIDFLKPYQPVNFKMTITGVGDQFASQEAFDEKLEQDVKAYAETLPGGLPEVGEARKAMIKLNVKPSPEQTDASQWMAKNTLVHDAYISKTKRGVGYTFRPDKILAFTQPLPSGVFLAVGSTKDSIAKFWAGIGALSPRGDSYRQLVLSPSQLENAQFTFKPVGIEGLEGKNFNRIRVLS